MGRSTGCSPTHHPSTSHQAFVEHLLRADSVLCVGDSSTSILVHGSADRTGGCAHPASLVLAGTVDTGEEMSTVIQSIPDEPKVFSLTRSKVCF